MEKNTMMEIVFITALGVGGASVIGTIIGFGFKSISHKFSDIVLSFAAGIMLAAAIIGLILPAMEYGGANTLFISVIGIFCGAACVNVIDKLVPHLHKLTGVEGEKHPESTDKLNKVLLFIIAIAIHNFPEGIAAGVGFGTGDTGQALSIAAAIALQNIPEGMIIVSPMLASGISPIRTFFIALIIGGIEVVGTLFGYYAVTISTAILPFALSFAGGTMLYIVSDEMIPETHSHGSERAATYTLLLGFCTMLILDFLLV